jgi:ornithine cyclodeaminase/alanine dehydrogenase-like protein (mu-crystallin family)
MSNERSAIHLSADDLRGVLDHVSLIDALADMFRDGCEAPVRHHHSISVPGSSDATMLLMPAWVPGKVAGAKIANVFPDNGAVGLPAVQSIYLLFSGKTGELLATLDGSELTTRRTVAASSLAVRYLARKDASRLLIVGTGQVARQLAVSHAAVRPISHVAVWGRNGRHAETLAAKLRTDGFEARAVDDLASAVGAADIVSCATLSKDALVRGEWLRPGTHLDLIGGFTPRMREADDEAIRRASVFIDTQGAMSEAGDILAPLESGALVKRDILAELSDLVRKRHVGRTSDSEITLFKSVGASAEDLAAAELAYRRVRSRAQSLANLPEESALPRSLV